jgi:excisionase family DNA binding protein
MGDQLIRLSDAARLLNVSRSTAYALAQRGEMPGLVRIGGAPRVSLAHLQAWIDDQARRATPTS